MILTKNDFYDTSRFYRIPKPAGESQEKELEAVIVEAEWDFLTQFNIKSNEITDEEKEALKYYTFAYWLDNQIVSKTSGGQGAKNNFKQSENEIDRQRFKRAFNRCAKIMNCELIDSFFNV